MAPVSHLSHPLFLPQASQLGVYRAFVDNYGVAMETAEKCCQANAQFAEISEVCTTLF